jgi:hypothetical protein
VHRGLLTDVVQSQPPAARVHGRPERQQNDLICMAADLPESVHAAAQIGGSVRVERRAGLTGGDVGLRSRAALPTNARLTAASPVRVTARICFALSWQI